MLPPRLSSITFERSLTTTELELTLGQKAGKLQGT